MSGAVGVALLSGGGALEANEGLIRLSQDDRNWVMPTKDYSATYYSRLDQINTQNVKNLKVAWSFSTGVLHGHEGGPLVVDGVMYIFHTPFPNNVYALDLNDPSKVLWEYKPKQDPAVRAVACCDVVNRGLAYAPAEGSKPAKIFLGQLDGHLVALDARTGEEIWKMEVCDIRVGATITQAPFVVKDKVLGLLGSRTWGAGLCFGLQHPRRQAGMARLCHRDEDIRLAPAFNEKTPQYSRFGLGLKT